MKLNKELTALTLACSLSATSLVGALCNTKDINGGICAVSTDSKQSVEGDIFYLNIFDVISESNLLDGCFYYNSDELRDEFPKYLFLQGTDFEIEEIGSGTIQYEFNGITDVSSTWDTDVSVFCNEDGSYSIMIWNSYLDIFGEVITRTLSLVKVSDRECKFLKEQFLWEEKLMSSFVKKRSIRDRRQKIN